MWLGKSLMVMGHAIHSSPSKKVTCVSDVSRGRGPSFLRFQSKQKGQAFPFNSFFSFYIYNTLHIQTYPQPKHTKTTFQPNYKSQWTQLSKFSIACLASLVQMADPRSRNAANTVSDTVQGTTATASKEANKSTSSINLQLLPLFSCIG